MQRSELPPRRKGVHTSVCEVGLLLVPFLKSLGGGDGDTPTNTADRRRLTQNGEEGKANESGLDQDNAS